MEEPSSTQSSVPATSRLCVKNLPKYISEKRLKEHFAAKGLITDAKIVKTKDGKSRCFAFIGYRSIEDAKAALDYFGGTYIDTARLDVEYAQPFGKSLDHRPWSKYTQGTSSHNAIEAKKKAAEGKEDAPPKLKAREAMKLERAQKEAQKAARTAIPTDDPKLAEFMELMAPRSKKATWSNDDAIRLTEQVDAERSAVLQRPSGTSAVEMPRSGLGQPTGDNDEEESEGASPSGSEDEPAVKEQVLVDDTASHLDYLRSRQTGKASFSDDEDEENGVTAAEEEDKEQANEGESSENEDEEAEKSSVLIAGEKAEVSDTGRLFLRNLAYAATDDELRELLEPYGELEDVHIVKDRATGQSKGFAHVQFKDPQDAVKTQTELDGSIFQGRLLHILAGRPAPASDATADAQGAKSFKEERAQAKKGSAGKATNAWNSLFVRADTVAEAIAAHFGIPKSALLDKESPDVAVRMALGEAQVFAATKEALMGAGVSVEALESAAAASGAKGAAGSIQRSDRTILVKNLPWSSDEAELSSLFAEAAGNPSSRFVLPPTKALAVVEFDDAADAKRAFRRLAYKNYQHAPLYLEWAPKNIFSGKRKPKEKKIKEESTVPAATTLEHPESKSTAAATARISADSNDFSGSATIYVKNLAWATQESGLRTHFEDVKTLDGQKPQLRSVRIAKKRGPDGKPLSAGYGFVECESEAGAKELISALQGSVLEGHKLILQVAQSKQLGAVAKPQEHKGLGTKMVVRNVAFEATRKDIMALFTAFGDVKSCRLPRKFDGMHRGFAFVEFSSKQEAKNAFEAVQGTHLYGRRLVIESAEEEGGLEELRAKTAAKFSGILESEGGMKRELPEDGNPEDNRSSKKKKKNKAAAT